MNRPKGMEKWTDVDTLNNELSQLEDDVLVDKKFLISKTGISHVSIPLILNSCGLSSKNTSYTIKDLKARFVPAVAMLLNGKTHDDIRAWAEVAVQSDNDDEAEDVTDLLETLVEEPASKLAAVLQQAIISTAFAKATAGLGSAMLNHPQKAELYGGLDSFCLKLSHRYQQKMRQRLEANILDGASVPELKRISPAPLEDDIDLINNNNEE